MADRINPVSVEAAKPDVKSMYNELQKKFGRVPNIFLNMGNSPAVLKGFLGLNEAVAQTSLDPKVREEIALVVGQTNQCQYCLSAHTAIAKVAGIPDNDILLARKGDAKDPKTQAILKFTKKVVEQKANINDGDIQALKKAGVNETEITEIIMTITMNLFSNYFNLITGTKVDFPEAPKLS